MHRQGFSGVCDQPWDKLTLNYQPHILNTLVSLNISLDNRLRDGAGNSLPTPLLLPFLSLQIPTQSSLTPPSSVPPTREETMQLGCARLTSDEYLHLICTGECLYCCKNTLFQFVWCAQKIKLGPNNSGGNDELGHCTGGMSTNRATSVTSAVCWEGGFHCPGFPGLLRCSGQYDRQGTHNRGWLFSRSYPPRSEEEF